MKKDIKFSTRMASEDREAIKELAKRSGMSMSDYVTACCLGKQVVVVDGLKEVLKELKSIGRNLNQLVTLAHMGRITVCDGLLFLLSGLCLEERSSMKTEYEKYRETGMLGGYDPGRALLQEIKSGEVLTSFRDTCYQHQDDHMINQREMLIGGKVFHVTSVFPMEATATPTDKLLSLINTDLKKEAHSA